MCQTCANLSTFSGECHFPGAGSNDPTSTGPQGASPHDSWTDQQIADQLTRAGSYWYGDNGDNTIYYSFGNDMGSWDNFGGNITSEFGVDATQQFWIEAAFDQLAQMFDLNFVEDATPSNTSTNPPVDFIQFFNDPGSFQTIDGQQVFYDGTYALSYSYGAGDHAFSNIVFDSDWDSNQSANLEYGSYGYMTILHEILHSLGLSHPGSYNAAPGVSITYQNDAEFEQDTHRYTVMSYFDSYEDGSGAAFYDIVNDKFVYPRTPMVYDILAMTAGDFNGNFAGYSANSTTRNNDTHYGYNATASIDAAYDFDAHGAPVLTIYDTGGIDTLDLSGDTVNQEIFVNYDANGVVIDYGLQTRTTTLIDLREGAYSSTHGMTYNIGIAFGTEIENAIGTIFDDTIYGNDLNNTLEGGSGNDFLDGGAGSDVLLGGFDNDIIMGGDQSDFLAGGGGDDELYGGDGDDKLNGGRGEDIIDGGTGIDRLFYANSTSAVHINLASDVHSGGHAEGDQISNIENIVGSKFNDVIVGNDQENTLSGGEGDDLFEGLGGADIFRGNSGIDTVTYVQSTEGISINLEKNTALYGDAQGDTFFGIENIVGSSENDSIVGGKQDNVLSGGTGDDYLFGNDGNDLLIGGGGNDVLLGGIGDDRLLGNKGDDTLNGGSGADTIFYSLGGDNDTINNFENDVDTLELDSALWANNSAINSVSDLLDPNNGYATQIDANTIRLDFDNGDTITINGGSSTFSLLDLHDDLVIV